MIQPRTRWDAHAARLFTTEPYVWLLGAQLGFKLRAGNARFAFGHLRELAERELYACRAEELARDAALERTMAVLARDPRMDAVRNNYGPRNVMGPKQLFGALVRYADLQYDGLARDVRSNVLLNVRADPTFEITGLMDIVERDEQTGRHIVVECKATSGYVSDATLETYARSWQARTYALFAPVHTRIWRIQRDAGSAEFYQTWTEMEDAREIVDIYRRIHVRAQTFVAHNTDLVARWLDGDWSVLPVNPAFLTAGVDADAIKRDELMMWAQIARAHVADRAEMVAMEFERSAPSGERFRLVSHNSAARNGEPFVDLIRQAEDHSR